VTIQVRVEPGDDPRAAIAVADVIRRELAARSFPFGPTPAARELRVEVIGDVWKAE
jgi:hypothetical protein